MKILDIAGLVSVATAAFLTSLPAGFLATGAGCLWLSWSMARSPE